MAGIVSPRPHRLNPAMGGVVLVGVDLVDHCFDVGSSPQPFTQGIRLKSTCAIGQNQLDTHAIVDRPIAVVFVCIGLSSQCGLATAHLISPVIGRRRCL